MDSHPIPYTSEDILNHHGIGAVILNEKGEILMQEHVKYNFWTIPIGKTKQGQTPQKALKEELFEECNIRIKEWKEIATKEFRYIRNGKEVHVLGHIFTILSYAGTIQNKEPHKHKEQCFMSVEKIQQLPVVSDLTLLWLESQGIQREKCI